jgi:2-oxoisovalerate dehydrogenase E1 component beta subunit
MNLFNAINSALACALEEDPKVLVFGEDVAFGGVFRCTSKLQQRFGRARVFNTPLSEQGIAGFAAGLAAMGYRPVAEIQFADYIYPAFDQIVNEIAKYRYRSGGQFHCGGVVIRAPCGAVGHGGHYHSQSPEAYFLHTAGIKVVVPRDPFTAKGLLMQSIWEDDPVVFFEPKALYRSAQAEVPQGTYALPLGQAQIVRSGSHVTLIAYGAQVQVLLEAAETVAREHGIDAEVIDLQTILPWDESTVCESVSRTGRCIVSHEAPVTGGVGAEVVARVQEECFLDLESPVMRVCGYDMPFPLVHEKHYVPSAAKVVDAIRTCLNF